MGSFVIHHVGARFGNAPFPIPPKFADGIELVLYDADSDCVEGLEEAGLARNQRIVAACLSDTDSVAEFRLTLNSPASSLLEPAPAAAGIVQSILGIDWDAGSFDVIERRSVETWRLDTLLSRRPGIPAPDFLSLDTQGSESAILSGAGEIVRSSVVGLIVEVQFAELYEGVPQFGAVATQLGEAGFHFAGFRDMNNAYLSTQPIGRRSAGYPVSADALFLRRIDSIHGPDAPGRLARLAFAAVVFGFLDQALAALERYGRMQASADSPAWLAFVVELHRLAATTPSVFAPTFSAILQEDQRQAFSREADMRRWPQMMDLSGWRAGQEAALGMPVEAALAAMENPGDTPIEAHLRAHGFEELADATNLVRRDQAHKTLRFIRGTI